MTIEHKSGFGGRTGFGERPCLLIIDMNKAFTLEGSPLRCDLDDVVGSIAQLLAANHQAHPSSDQVVDTVAGFSQNTFLLKRPVVLEKLVAQPHTRNERWAKPVRTRRVA